MSHSHNAAAAVEALLHSPMNSTVATADSYFSYAPHSGLLLAHIVLMTLAWFFILPLTVMLSIARSRLTLALQMLFLSMNAVALLLGTIYNGKTPDLYENNAHHKLGWAVTWIALAQAVLGLVRAYCGAGQVEYESPTLDYQKLQDIQEVDTYRFSSDSGHGTDTASPRSSSLSSKLESEDDMVDPQNPHDSGGDPSDMEKRGLIGNTAVDRFLSRKLSWIAHSRALTCVEIIYSLVDRTILILGFVALASGVVAYGGIFRGNHIFGGMAHFVKGGIFFWYGLFSLGRCMGAFADLGWAWNIKPSANLVGSRKAAIPSAEFVESFLIFFYGASNVWLEHLAAWGGAWTAQDLEHVSITIMFFGGGLCGMLIESKTIRDMLNTAFLSYPTHDGTGSSLDPWQVPKTYRFSMNPLPGLIIMLLGLMMSSHHQASMISTMVHKQWGTLFVGAALARGVTYILTYLSPPVSLLPSRPPSELVVSFCLISGGLIFMASSRDTVASMEAYNLDAMFIFTAMMGLTAFLMAWTIIVLAVKGWAVRHSHKPTLLWRHTPSNVA